jgi:hypothetical protein
MEHRGYKGSGNFTETSHTFHPYDMHPAASGTGTNSVEYTTSGRFSKTDGYYPVPNKTGALRPIGEFSGKTSGAMPKDGDSKTNYWIDGR